MAIINPKQTVEIMQSGMNLADLTNGVGWIQNLWRYQNAWQTRDGFGVADIVDSQFIASASEVTSELEVVEPRENGSLQIHGAYTFTTSFGHQQTILLVKSRGNISELTQQNGQVFGILASISKQSAVGYNGTFWSVLIYDHTTTSFLEEPLYKKTTENKSLQNLNQFPSDSGISGYPFSPSPLQLISDASNVGKQHGVLEGTFIPFQTYTGLYETTWDSEEDPITPCFFTEIEDIVYFGNRETGIFYYIPTIFGKERSKKIDNQYNKSTANGYSETSVIKKVKFGEPSTADETRQGFVYLTEEEIGTVVDITEYDGRLVILGENKIINYSEPGNPSSVIADNRDFISSDKQVTGIAQVGGRIVSFTETETFVCQPSTTTVIIASQRVIRINDTIGCASPMSKTKQQGALWFCDRNGVYSFTNGISEVGQVLDKFFNEHITNPLTNYYSQGLGIVADYNDPQPAIQYSYLQPPQLIYDNVRKHLMVNFIDLGISFVWNTDFNMWYVWNFRSVVSTSVDQNNERDGRVEQKNKLRNFWVTYSNENMFGFFGDVQDIFSEQKINAGSGTTTVYRSYRSRPLYITQYGKGGSLDRSNIVEEDRRKITDTYYQIITPTGTEYTSSLGPGAIVFDKPYWINDPDYLMPSGDTYASGAITLQNELPSGSFVTPGVMWVPVSLILPDDSAGNLIDIDRVGFAIRFDFSMWQPALRTNNGSTYYLDYELPPERVPLQTEVGMPIYGLVVDSAGDNTSPYFVSGSTLLFNMELAGSPINFVNGKKNPIVNIPFRRVTLSGSSYSNNNAFSLNIIKSSGSSADQGFVIDGFIISGTAGERSLSAYAYDGFTVYPNIEAKQYDDRNVQAVDWIYKSQTIGDGTSGLKPRGTIAQMTSRGHSENPIEEGWRTGLYNISVSTNFKDYQTQYIDVLTKEQADQAGVDPSTNTPPLDNIYGTPAQSLTFNKNTNIGTLYKANQDTLTEKTFNNYGYFADPNGPTGNILIDNATFSNIVTSDGTRGDRFSYMLFGHVRDKAERLYFKSVKAVYKVIGSLRRYGR
jgi:hypothetical protein